MESWKNKIVDPELTTLAYTAGEHGLNPRPEEGSPAFEDLAEYPEDDDFVDVVGYKGAFLNNWASKWSFLSTGGYFTEEYNAVEKIAAGRKTLLQNVAGTCRQSVLDVRYTVPADGKVSVRLYSLNGKYMANLADGFHKAGTHHVIRDISGIANGLYICNLTTGARKTSSTVTVNR